MFFLRYFDRHKSCALIRHGRLLIMLYYNTFCVCFVFVIDTTRIVCRVFFLRYFDRHKSCALIRHGRLLIMLYNNTFCVCFVFVIDTTRIVCRESLCNGTVSVCPGMCPQQQTRCCRFAAVGPADDCCTAGARQQRRANAGSATLSAYVL